MNNSKKSFSIINNPKTVIKSQSVPNGSLHGIFKGYSYPVEWIVTEYPSNEHDTPTLLVWTGVAWYKNPPYQRYKKLYQHVNKIIADNNLYGKKTIPWTGNIPRFQNFCPTGRKQRITGLKSANKLYYDRAGHGSTKYSPYADSFIRKNNGETDVSSVSTKNITY